MAKSSSRKSGPTAAGQKIITEIADKTLSFFEKTSEDARSKLEDYRQPGAAAFAAVNTFNATEAVRNLTGITDDTRLALLQLLDEPAIARLVLRDEDGKESTIYVSRGATLQGIASYRSPIGRMASLPVGGDADIPTGKGMRNYQLIQRVALHPLFDSEEWDSRNNVVQGKSFGPVTVVSLRELLKGEEIDTGADLLAAMLAEGRAAENIIEGLRRSAITKMGLRDQPLLDQYQDEIFRLPLGSRLVILGPPGTGKTTTLIKRLGLKLDNASQDHLSEDEQALVARSLAGPNGHRNSWLMFTPTELLKLYVKEAFAREGIAAPDARLHTWRDFRLELARNRFGILRSAAGTGSFVLKDALESLQTSVLERQTVWFDDFNVWQEEFFWSEMATHAKALAENSDPAFARIGARLTRVLADRNDTAARRFIAIGDLSGALQELAAALKAETDIKIRTAFAKELTKDQTLLNRLVDFVATLSEGPEDLDDPEADDEEEIRPQKIDREAAFDAYTRAVRAQARARVANRSLGSQTRNAKIIKWLGGLTLPPDELRAIGSSLQLQTSARRFVNPLRRFITGIPGRYRRFRRERQAENRWYNARGFLPGDLAPLEADVIILAMLKAARALLGDPRIATEVADGKHSPLGAIRGEFITQIVVDEATDFSPLQLASMAGLCDPTANSFLACGDFNQRVTGWGSRSIADLKWVFADMDVRSINITYRHSRQLNELARRIALLSGTAVPESQLPQHIDNEGVRPVLAHKLSTHKSTSAWLAKRIGEIERLTGSLPSIAVLVNSEEDVEPLAKDLDAALTDKNIKAVACLRGQAVGQESDVRVFDVQHIKGLEFEGVFFVGVDRLAKNVPDLFDKYLYVGTTRAAYYLGVTTEGAALPAKIASLKDAFGEHWP